MSGHGPDNFLRYSLKVECHLSCFLGCQTAVPTPNTNQQVPVRTWPGGGEPLTPKLNRTHKQIFFIFQISPPDRSGKVEKPKKKQIRKSRKVPPQNMGFLKALMCQNKTHGKLEERGRHTGDRRRACRARPWPHRRPVREAMGNAAGLCSVPRHSGQVRNGRSWAMGTATVSPNARPPAVLLGGGRTVSVPIGFAAHRGPPRRSLAR